MLRGMKRIIVTLMVLSSTACGSGTSGEVQDNQSVDHSLFPSTVTLAVEETVTVSGDLSIRLDRLEDQLCPCLDLCITGGHAVADVVLMDKNAELGAVTLEVGDIVDRTTDFFGESARTGTIGDYVLRLDTVIPNLACDDPYADPGVVITIKVD